MKVLTMLPAPTLPSVCADGCYKQYVEGFGWICCKCGG